MPKIAKEGERVYLLRGRSIELPGGGRAIYPAGYYHLPPEQAAEWVRNGLAVPESEWEARQAQAAQAAAADPIMHLAGPHGPAPAASAPAGNMWPAGPKDAPKNAPKNAPKGPQQPAVEPVSAPGQPSGPDLDAAAAEEQARQATGAQDSADVKTSANQEE